MDKPDPQQIAIYQALSPADKWRAIQDLYWSARNLKAAHARQTQPELTETQVQQRAKEIFMHASE